MKFSAFAGKITVVAPLGLALLGIMGSPAWASKYGIVDMQAVILNVEEGKAARAALEKEIKEKQKDLVKRKEELDKLNKDWTNQAALLSEEARLTKQKDFQEKFMSLRNDEMEFEAGIKRKEQKATQGIAMKVAGLVDKMAKEKKLEAVFETNSAGLLYLESPQDLTKEVVGRFAKEAKSPAVQADAKDSGKDKK